MSNNIKQLFELFIVINDGSILDRSQPIIFMDGLNMTVFDSISFETLLDYVQIFFLCNNHRSKGVSSFILFMILSVVVNSLENRPTTLRFFAFVSKQIRGRMSNHSKLTGIVSLRNIVFMNFSFNKLRHLFDSNLISKRLPFLDYSFLICKF